MYLYHTVLILTKMAKENKFADNMRKYDRKNRHLSRYKHLIQEI